MTSFNESTVELAALEYFRDLGYHTVFGPMIAPDEPGAERTSFGQVYLYRRLREAVRRINPGVSAELIDEAVKRLERAESQDQVEENARVHGLLTKGVPVEYRALDGTLRTTSVWLVDLERPDNNDWLAVNQFTIVENGKNRRPDVLVFVNGLPLSLLELKNPADEKATLRTRGTRSRHTAPTSRRCSRRTR